MGVTEGRAVAVGVTEGVAVTRGGAEGPMVSAGCGVSRSIDTVSGADIVSGRTTILSVVQTAACSAFGPITAETASLLTIEPRTVPSPLVTAQLAAVPVQSAAPPLI